MIDVVNDLKDSGYNFDISWFDPFLNLDSHIMVTIDNVQLEIRNRAMACTWRRAF
jgi:uncharacterized protein (DUF2126 family)